MRDLHLDQALLKRIENSWGVCVSNETLVYDTPDLERVCDVPGKGEVVTKQHLTNVSTDFRV